MGTELYVNRANIGPRESEVLIPTHVFWERERSFLEGIVWWLREEKGLRYSEIGCMLSRDQRNIWTVYDRAKKKSDSAQKTKTKKDISVPIVSLPIQVLCERQFSIMESAVLFLRESAGMSNQQVSIILNRSRKTVSTVYVRAMKKKEHKVDAKEKN